MNGFNNTSKKEIKISTEFEPKSQLFCHISRDIHRAGSGMASPLPVLHFILRSRQISYGDQGEDSRLGFRRDRIPRAESFPFDFLKKKKINYHKLLL